MTALSDKIVKGLLVISPRRKNFMMIPVNYRYYADEWFKT